MKAQSAGALSGVGSGEGRRSPYIPSMEVWGLSQKFWNLTWKYVQLVVILYTKLVNFPREPAWKRGILIIRPSGDWDINAPHFWKWGSIPRSPASNAYVSQAVRGAMAQCLPPKDALGSSQHLGFWKNHTTTATYYSTYWDQILTAPPDVMKVERWSDHGKIWHVWATPTSAHTCEISLIGAGVSLWGTPEVSENVLIGLFRITGEETLKIIRGASNPHPATPSSKHEQEQLF